MSSSLEERYSYGEGASNQEYINAAAAAVNADGDSSDSEVGRMQFLRQSSSPEIDSNLFRRGTFFLLLLWFILLCQNSIGMEPIFFKELNVNFC